MTGRILTLQRQARELGRLRSGYTDTSARKPRPVRSNTWVITSHAEHYVAAAAEQWGGTVERWQPLGSGAEQWRVITTTDALDAILPPGDPLTQSYETWSRGGCARRCDGVTEQLSDRPCLCRAEHGDEWWTKPKGEVCAATTRLNLILPQMPDVGVWRLETHSHYAANEIAAHVDLIRSATRGETAVPVRVRIEQRTRVAGGETKHFPVVAVELRGVTAGQILGGQVLGQIDAVPTRPALAAAPPPAAPAVPTVGTASGKPLPSDDETEMLVRQIADAATVEQIRAMWRDIVAAFHVDQGGQLERALRDRAAQLQALAEAAPAGPDPDALWVQIVQAVPESWTSAQLEKDFAEATGVSAEDASGEDMQRYLQLLPERTKAAS